MLAVVALNMGGPDSPAAVKPFLRNLFADPDIIQLRWARPLQPILARFIAHRRAPFSRAAYAQIGGRSPIREESTAQVQAVVAAMAASGVVAKPYLAMSYWHPFPAETAAAMQADGITRALLLPLYPHRSRTTSGSAFRTIESALKRTTIATARIEELIEELKKNYTIIIVTHNMQQAARISDETAFFYLGNLVEYNKTDKIFTNPDVKHTEDYITGRFG